MSVVCQIDVSFRVVLRSVRQIQWIQGVFVSVHVDTHLIISLEFRDLLQSYRVFNSVPVDLLNELRLVVVSDIIWVVMTTDVVFVSYFLRLCNAQAVQITPGND